MKIVIIGGLLASSRTKIGVVMMNNSSNLLGVVMMNNSSNLLGAMTPNINPRIPINKDGDQMIKAGETNHKITVDTLIIHGKIVQIDPTLTTDHRTIDLRNVGSVDRMDIWRKTVESKQEIDHLIDHRNLMSVTTAIKKDIFRLIVTSLKNKDLRK